MSYKIAEVTIEGTTPYQQGKHYSEEEFPMDANETKERYELRTWKNRAHFDAKGIIFIPGAALKIALESTARYLGLTIKGQGKKTWTKKFESGIMIMDNASLGVSIEDVHGAWVFGPSNGQRGGGTRVNRCFPTIQPGWTATFKIYVLDNIITEDILLRHLEACGKFIGLGVYRPENRGFHGRFIVKSLDWSDEAE